MMAPNGATETDPEGGFPLYILDDDTLVIVVSDMSHCDFWESTVAAIVAEERGLRMSDILNLPYCQRRARIVGNRLYCGEEVSPALLRSIEAATGRHLTLVSDEHEARCSISVADFTSLVKQPTRGGRAVPALLPQQVSSPTQPRSPMRTRTSLPIITVRNYGSMPAVRRPDSHEVEGGSHER